jgi:hypothetical protein
MKTIAVSLKQSSAWHAGFLAIMPEIANRAHRAYGHLRAQARANAVQDAIVNSMLAYVRLFRRGELARVFPSVLTRFAVAQYRDGRCAGEKLNCRDVLSSYARRRKGIHVTPLDMPGPDGESWRDVLVEDRHAGPAETAAARIDVTAWFLTLNRRDRRIAKALSEGQATRDVARQFHVSPARISQKRRELFESWQEFQGDRHDIANVELVSAGS